MKSQWYSKFSFESNIPQQDNSADCGLYVCKFAECLASGQDLDAHNFGRFLRQNIQRAIEAQSLHQFTTSHQVQCTTSLTQKKGTKRKRENNPFESSRKVAKIIPEDKLSLSYRLYGSDVPLSVINNISQIDKQHNISSVLGFSITANYLLSQGREEYCWDPIQMVRTTDLINFREHDREVTPKNPNQDPQEVLDALANSVLAHGFMEPLMLACDPVSKQCRLVEGNTRLSMALQNYIDYVPLKVVVAKVEGGFTPPKTGKSVITTKNLFPSQIGLTTLNTAGSHPYLPNHLINSINNSKRRNSQSFDTIMYNLDIEKEFKLKEVSLSMLFADHMEVDQVGDI